MRIDDADASLACGHPKDGVASLACGHPKDGVASLAYGRPKDGVASLAYGHPSHLVGVGRPELMAGWLAALTGIMTLLLLAFPTFLTALLLLATILLMVPALLLLGPFQFLFFLSVHFESPTTISALKKLIPRPRSSRLINSSRGGCGPILAKQDQAWTG